MAASTPAFVKPEVLKWARTTIGFDPVGAARKIGVPDDRVQQWEDGKAQPSIAQLRKAAEAYNRSLAVFFLPAPPADFDTLRDFRRHINYESGAWSPELHTEYRRALLQRDYVLELDELEDKEPSSRWRLESVPENVTELASAARRLLLLASPLDIPTSSDPRLHLNAWTAALESAGVLVMATRGGKVSTKEMRAFSLYFDEVPVIVLNGADYTRGRLFSLLHEYAHLLLHTAGLCDTTTDKNAVDPDRVLEAKCNAIAAAILMPENDVLERPEVEARRDTPTAWTYDALRQAAGPFGVSAEAFLRRLVTLERSTQAFYKQQRAAFLARYEKDEEESRSKGGGNFYNNTARDLGKGYVRQVTDAHSRRVIDSAAAATYLGIKVNQIPKLAVAASIRAVS